MGSRNPERYTDKPDWHMHRTLGQMKASGWRLSTWCTNCGHSAPVVVGLASVNALAILIVLIGSKLDL